MLFLDALHNTRKYGPALTTHDILKAFAIVLMVVDHVGYVFFPEDVWWRVFGRMCVPIWFFLVGYASPRRFPDELITLGAMLLVTDLWVGERALPLNIFATILAARLYVAYAERIVQDGVALATMFTISAVLLPLSLVLFEYGSQVFPLSLAGFYYRHYRHHWLAPVSLGVAWAFFCAAQYVFFHFSDLQGLIMASGCGLVCLTLHHHHLKPLPSTLGRWYSMPVALFARNSHYVYTLHLMAFLLGRAWWNHTSPFGPMP